MAARVIDVLETYLKSLRSAAAAPLTFSTNEQARTIFNKLSEIDGLHADLRQKVQNIQRAKKRKAELLLKRTPSHSIIRANLRRIYGSKPGEPGSQNASSLRDAHAMVVWQWIRTIPTKDWDNGAMSEDVRSLVVARMAETQEALVLTPRELEVMEQMTREKLKESKKYVDFYNTIHEFYRQQKSSIPNILNISTQQAPQPPSSQNDTTATTVQGRTSPKRRRLQNAEDTGYHSPRREKDTGCRSSEGTDYHSTRREVNLSSGGGQFAYELPPRARTDEFVDDEEREIELVYTNAPVENISFLSEPTASSVDHSMQRNSERAIRATYTNCISVLIPKGVTKDMSVNILIGREMGWKLIDFLELQLEDTPKLRPKPSDRPQLQNTLTGIVH